MLFPVSGFLRYSIDEIGATRIGTAEAAVGNLWLNASPDSCGALRQERGPFPLLLHYTQD